MAGEFSKRQKDCLYAVMISVCKKFLFLFKKSPLTSSLAGRMSVPPSRRGDGERSEQGGYSEDKTLWLIRGALISLVFATSFLGCQKMENDQTQPPFTGAKGEVKIMTLDPGHFHAGLVQKFQYAQVDSVVHIYAPEGPELQDHLNRINGYNQRAENPTNWDSQVYKGPDYLEKMIAEGKGNVVVLSGNNGRKTQYIQSSIAAGFNVLADKPMAIQPAHFQTLEAVFQEAEEKGVLLYDIMTERYEITTILQKALSQNEALFGQLEKGSPENPAITKESVHHFAKQVSGKALIRPPWFFDVAQQGEGMVDVATHLVDLVFWECFPAQVIDYPADIEIAQARHWATTLNPAQFAKVTGLTEYPSYLEKDVTENNQLEVFSNGEINFSVKGVHAKVSVIWDYEAPEGAGDTHYSIMRGSRSNLIIRQGAAQNYRPMLYVETADGSDPASLEKDLQAAIDGLARQYPGLAYQKATNGWEVRIPDQYKVGHEAHFAQVTEKYLQFLVDGKLPDWEVPNMLAKYYVTTKAYEMSR
jgi:predicted dehydrogenase